MWMRNLTGVTVALILATIWGVWKLHRQSKIATRTYVGTHHRDPDAAYEKRYDWTYAKKALGREFTMPVHYDHA